MVKESTLKCIDDLIARYPQLAECRADLQSAVEIVCDSYRQGHKLIACGNGGSASDSEHIVGELMKGFLLKREIKGELAEKIRQHCGEDAQYLIDNLQGALTALSMVNQVALNTAFPKFEIENSKFKMK